VAANLGDGLRYDSVTGTLAVRLSNEAGNAARFGSDRGIYVPGGDTNPDPASGRKTIAGLPARAFCANQGGGGSMMPFGDPNGIEYAVSNRMDMVSFHTFALADGIAINRTTNPESDLSAFTDNPSSIDFQEISSVVLPSLSYDVGTRVNPTGRNSGAPASLLSPDGGWFGFYAQPFAPMTLAEALHRLAARAVAYLAVYSGFDEVETPRNVSAAINAVLQVGSQDWTILGFSPYVDDGTGNIVISPLWTQWAADVIAAGITPAADLFEDLEDGVAITPQAVIDAGIQWVRFKAFEPEGGTSMARIQQFIDAGLQVIVQATSRQFDTQRLYAAGARVVMADSPVYARGGRGEAGDLDYRKTVLIPGLQTRTCMEGSLTRRTNNGFDADRDVGWCRQSAPGRYFSARFGWEGGIGAHLMSQLLGELCPHETPPSWRLRVRFRIDPTQATHPSGNVPKQGLFVCAPTDQDITNFEEEGQPNLKPSTNGYLCFVRVGSSDQGRVELRKITDGVDEPLATDEAFPSIAIGAWIYMSFTATATGINLAVGHQTQADDIIYQVNDTTHRGPYAHYIWEDDYRLPAENDGFAHGYAPYERYSTDRPMWEDLS